MSEKETARINELEQKVEQIYTAISGDKEMGLKGLVEVLNEHVAQSKRNNEVLLGEFKDFRKNVVLDYANDINNITNRLQPLEKAHKEQARNIGIVGGIALVVGYFVAELSEFFKMFK